MWDRVIRRKKLKNNVTIYSPLKRVKKSTDKIYISGTYLSLPFMCLIQPQKIDKHIYMLKGQSSFIDTLSFVKKYGVSELNFYHLLSSFPLKFLYKKVLKTWNIKTLYFPTQTSLETFIKKIPEVKHLAKVLPSPIISHRPSKRGLWKKKKDELWITYAGRAHRARGIEDLIAALSNLKDKYKNVKFILAFLPDKDTEILTSLVKKSLQEKVYIHVGKLTSSKYARLQKDSDIFVGPFAHQYSCPDRPATLLEAMVHNSAVVTSQIIEDSFFKDGYNCRMYRSSPELEITLEKLIRSKKLRKSITANATKSVRTLKKQIEKHELYK